MYLLKNNHKIKIKILLTEGVKCLYKIIIQQILSTFIYRLKIVNIEK